MADQDNKNPPAGADKNPPKAPAPAAATGDQYTVAENGDILTGNLTRDSIAVQLRGKFTEEGKSQEEATKLAVKRAYEMVRG